VESPRPAPADHSTTNVQEAGVDEPDVVKTNGALVLALAGETLHSIDVTASPPQRVDSLDFRPIVGAKYAYAWPRELLLVGGRALVFVDTDQGTVLAEVSVAADGDLRFQRSLEVEGYYVGARLTGSVARVVLRSYPHYPNVRRAGDGQLYFRARAPRWLPSGQLRDRVAKSASSGPLVRCGDVSRPDGFSGLEMLTVLTVDLSVGLPPTDADAVLTSGEIVYGSAESLYIATEHWFEGDPEADRASDVSTEVHKFDLTEDPPGTEYLASGEVPGYMLSQWSMSEWNGDLRVASTTSPPWRNEERERSESLVTVLRESDGELGQVGQVGGLGRGERIYAVRFIDDVGYVVTFRQVDPLYTVDLADPTAPTVVGELKVAGYSAYLHPVADDLLLGIGQDATEEGRTRGTQLSLFDVSDPAAPTRLHQHALASDSSSEVEYDHHAFLYWAPESLAVLPVETYGSRGYEPDFIGAIGFRVDPAAGIQEVARIAHAGGDRWTHSISRSLVIGDRLYTFSQRGLAADGLSSFERVGWVPFTDRPEEAPPVSEPPSG
jgi:uncharacterized secreted protein with C-terminal beta-propeller domain